LNLPPAGSAGPWGGAAGRRAVLVANESDLPPIEQAEKVELIINLRRAKKLGLAFPLSLLGRADEVIE
jgi:putative ABC transport system substrate-binding protein